MNKTKKNLYKISIWKTISSDYDDRVEKIADDIYHYAKDYLDLKNVMKNVLKERHLRDHDEGNYLITYGCECELVTIENKERFEQLKFDI